jgi:hypothetical protein
MNSDFNILSLAREIEIQDLIGVYTLRDIPGIQSIVTSKPEFAELESSPEEGIQPNGLYKPQELRQRLEDYVDDGLIIDEPGSGKTCSVVSFLEKAYDDMLRNPDASRFRRAYIFAPNDTLLENIKFQIACKCTFNKYAKEDDLYTKSNKTKELRPQDQRKRINKLMKKWYRFKSFGKFRNKFRKEFIHDGVVNVEGVKAKYHNCIFWIDEVHMMRINPVNTKLTLTELLSLDPPDYEIATGKMGAKNKKIVTELTIAKSGKSVLHEAQDVWLQFFRLFHIAKGCKRFMTTATPVIGDQRKFIPIYNLLLPINKNPINVREFNFYTATAEQLAEFPGQIPYNFDLESATLEEVEPYFRGRIMYVKAKDTGIIRDYQTNPDFDVDVEKGYYYEDVFYEPQVITYNSLMSKFQAKVYLDVKEKEETQTKNVYAAERATLNWVFPDGSYGGEKIRERAGRDANAYIKFDPKTGKFNFDKSYISMLSGQKGLLKMEEYGVKYAAIIRAMKSSQHTVYIYGEIVNGSGIINLAACLEAQGYDRFDESSSVFLGAGKSKAKSYCAPRINNLEPRTIRPDFKVGKPRYAIFFGKRSNKTDIAFETFNSRENVNGDLIKVFIVSAIGKLGINLNHVDQAHVLQGGWTAEENKQALDRCTRSDSHDVILEMRVRKERNKRLDPIIKALSNQYKKETNGKLQEILNTINNKYEEELRSRNLIVNTRGAIGFEKLRYDFIKLFKSKISSNFESIVATTIIDSYLDSFDELTNQLYKEIKINIKIYLHAAYAYDKETKTYDSFDVKMYYNAELKNRKEKKIIRKMKQCSLDCWINKKRNVRATDVDFTPNCDFDTCEVQCYEPKPDFIDYSTYDVFYAQVQINNVANELITYLGNHAPVKLEKIITDFPEIRHKILCFALEKIIFQNEYILDRFGKLSRLYEDNGLFLLIPLEITLNEKAMGYYTNNFIFANDIKPNLEESVNLINENTNLEDMISASDPDFNKKVELIPIALRANAVERALYDREILNKETKFDKKIIEAHKHLIFEFHRPETELARVEADPPKMREGWKVDPIRDEEKGKEYDTDTDEVWVHIVYTRTPGNSDYADTTIIKKAEGRTRILEPTSDHPEWRDMTKIEYYVYNKIIQDINSNSIESILKKKGVAGFYGTQKTGGKSFKIATKFAKRKNKKGDKREEYDGRDCKTIPTWRILETMFLIGMPAYDSKVAAYNKRLDRAKEADYAEIIDEMVEYRETQNLIKIGGKLKDAISELLDGNRQKGGDDKLTKADVESWDHDRIAYHASWYRFILGFKSWRNGYFCKYIPYFMKETGFFYET